jgi:plasmid stabilization system protein ParE
MLPVDFLPAAHHDFDESFDWYAERNPQAAMQFANAVDAALSMIAASPQRFAAIDNIHRGCSINHFPFRIVYRVTTDRIVVVAVAHAKREPGYWKKRV